MTVSVISISFQYYLDGIKFKLKQASDWPVFKVFFLGDGPVTQLPPDVLNMCLVHANTL